MTPVTVTRVSEAECVGVALRRGVVFIVATCLLACTSPPEYPPTAPSTGRRSPPKEASFTPSDLLKSDIDAVAEVHLRESIASAKLLMEKLYRRNQCTGG